MHILSYILRTVAIKQLPLEVLQLELSYLNFVHHCNHAQVSLKYQIPMVHSKYSLPSFSKLLLGVNTSLTQTLHTTNSQF